MPSFSPGDWQLLSRVRCACTRACLHSSLSLHRAVGAISVSNGFRAHSGVDGIQLGSTSATPAHSSGKLGGQRVTSCSWPALNFIVVDSHKMYWLPLQEDLYLAAFFTRCMDTNSEATWSGAPFALISVFLSKCSPIWLKRKGKLIAAEASHTQNAIEEKKPHLFWHYQWYRNSIATFKPLHSRRDSISLPLG